MSIHNGDWLGVGLPRLAYLDLGWIWLGLGWHRLAWLGLVWVGFGYCCDFCIVIYADRRRTIHCKFRGFPDAAQSPLRHGCMHGATMLQLCRAIYAAVHSRRAIPLYFPRLPCSEAAQRRPCDAARAHARYYNDTAMLR